MDQRPADTGTDRAQTVELLTRQILEQAKPHIDPNTPPEELKKTATQIAERINFEANVALSEVVTRYSIAKPKTAAPLAERMFTRFGRISAPSIC